ncbi:MAG TPA: LLM class flavin-dependent oxidoreductase [Candidatus Baltobacterales bacterium]|nr:LLM class flavin-dependent oxidoreductase [Candidatus Baltobacterales bacterium]
MTLRIGLGVFGMQSVPQRPDHHVKLYRDLLEDAELAESIGFDSIWLSEHHFWFDGYCPADLAAAGAILGRTTTLGVGTAVMLLPMHSVEKVADDAAVISRLGEGRLSLGVALGYRDPEFDGFGIRRKDRGKLMDAMLPRLAESCRQAEPPVPIYVGVATSIAAQRAARLGLPLFADSTMTVTELREMLNGYNAGARAAGVTPPALHALQRDVFVTDDRERDWSMLLPELRYMRRQYGGWSFPQEEGETTPAYLQRLEADIEAKLKNLIMGDADYVAARLREFEALGFGLIVCRSQFGNLPRESLHRAIRGLGKVRAQVST